MEISKELLSEVFGRNISEVEVYEENILRLTGDFNGFRQRFFFNIYELAYKCKEWANITKGKYLSSGYDEMDKKWEAMMMKYTFIADT